MNQAERSEQPTLLQRATTAAFLLLAGVVLLAGAVTLWQSYQLPSLGLSWTLGEGIVSIVDPDGPARGVLREGDRLLTLNGLRFVPGGNMVQIMNSVRPNQPAEMVIEREGTRQTITIIPAAMDLALEGHLIDYVGGVALWGLGLYVFLKRRYSITACLFLLTCLAATTTLWGNVSLFVDPWYAALRRLALSFLGPCLFVNLVVSLPYDRLARRPFFRLRLGYCGLSLLLGLAGAVAALLMTPWSYPLYVLILGNQGLGFAIAVALVMLTHRHLPRGAARDRYRGAVTFVILGGLPVVLVVMMGVWQGFRTFDTRQATLAMFAAPFAIGYVVLRYQFLGVRVAIRQGLTAILMLASTIATLLTAYVLAHNLLALVMADYVDALSLIIATLTAAILFEPTRRYIHRRLEHVLDRRSVELYKALESFSRELTTLQDLPSLLDSLTHQLEALFPRTRFLIVLHDEAAAVYRVIRTANPTSADQSFTFSTQGALAQQLRRGGAFLPHQWADALEHLPPEERRQAERLQPEVVIPLLARGDDLLGWIVLGAQGGDSSYDEREIALLVSLVNQASVALSNARLYAQTAQMVKELRGTNRQLVALQEIGASVTGHLSLREVLQRVLQGVLGSGDYSVATLGVFDETRAASNVALFRYVDPQLQAQLEDLIGHPSEQAWMEWRDEQHPAAQAIRQGQVYKFHDLKDFLGSAWDFERSTVDPARVAQMQRLSENQTYALLPLFTSKDLVGLLAVGTLRPDVPASEIEALRTFAYQAALAIENARLWEETDERLRQRVQELTTLNTIVEAVNSTLDLDEVLDRALTCILEVTHFDTGLIALLDETGKLQPTTSHNMPSPILDRLKHMPPDIVERIIHATPTLQDFCIVPLLARGDLVGVLGLGIRQEQDWSTEDLALAQAVAQQVSMAIANARLYRQAAEEQQKTESILQSVGDGVCTTDRDLILLSLNPAAERLLGWQEDQAIGQHCSEVLQCHDGDGEPLCETACPLAVALRERRYDYSRLGMLFMRSRGGQRIPIWGVAGPLIDPAGTVLGGVLAFRDASREAEMDRLQSEFISMISHEVRAPLTNLKAAAQTFIRLGAERNAKVRANLTRIIVAQCDRLDQLVQSVEDSARFETGRLDLQIVPLHLPPLARDMIRLFQSREQQRTFDVLTTDEPALWVRGNEDKIGTILNNLLDNAAKYSHPQGTITVQLALWEQDQVLVSVIDEGPSIPADQRDRIFQRFYRLDNSDARSIYGLGLGLHIAQALVTAMDGQIWVDEADGSGNRFCFTLPRSRDTLPRSRESAPRRKTT